MMSIVAIKEVKGVVKCGEDGKATHVFNVRNSVDGKIRIGTQIAVTAPAELKWLEIEGSGERDLDPETMTQFAVNIQVPPDCKPGKYSYRLRVFDPDNPGEKYTDGENVYFEVVGKPVEVTTTDDDKKPRWIPYAIAAGVLILIIGVAIKFWPKETLVTVPDLGKLSLFNALQKINSNELTFNGETGLLSRRVSDSSQVGFIVDQEPDAMAKVPQKTPIKLWVGVAGRVNLSQFITIQDMNKVKTMKHIVIPGALINRSIEPEPENN